MSGDCLSVPAVIFFLTVLLSGVSYADVAYLHYDDQGTHSPFSVMHYIQQDSSGNLRETSYDFNVSPLNGYKPDEAVFFFRHNGQRKLLVEMRRELTVSASDENEGNNDVPPEPANDEAALYAPEDTAVYAPEITFSAPVIAVYDPENFTAPSASGDIGEWDLYSLCEFGSNILLEGHTLEGEIEAVIEVNPETCSVTGRYYADIGSMTVHKNVIYLASNDSWIEGQPEDNYAWRIPGEGITMMDRLGHVCGRVNGVGGTIISSGENLYFRCMNEIYRIDGDISSLTLTSADFFSSYAVKAADTGSIHLMNENMCTDGNGGLYYSVNGDICHLSGSTSAKVYTGGDEIPRISWLKYDSSTQTMFIAYIDGSYTSRIAALKQDSSGNFTFARAFGTTVIDWGSEIAFIDNSQPPANDSTRPEDNNPPADDNTRNDDTQSEDSEPSANDDTQSENNTSADAASGSSGGCNSGMAVLSVILAGAAVFRKK